jgi:hypothetical protein
VAIPCESSITHVHVFARGARVTRRAVPTGAVADGEVTLALDGLPTLAAPGSFRVSLPPEAAGRALVLVRSTLVVPAGGSLLGRSLEAVRELERRIRRIDRRAGLAHRRRDAITSARLDPEVRANRAPDDPRSALPRTRETLAAQAMLAALAADLDARLDALHRERHGLARALEGARAEAAQARSSELVGAGRPTRRALITVRGDGPLPHLDVTYAVDAARWWPVYTLRIRDHARAATWISEALVAQRSGEDWRDARVELSTANMLFDARMPTLPSMRFGRAQPAPKPAFRPPPAGVDAMFGGFDRAFAAPTVAAAPPPPPPAEPEWQVDALLAEGAAAMDYDEAVEATRSRAPVPQQEQRGGYGGAPGAPAAASPMVPPPQAMRRSVPLPKSAGLLAGAMSFGAGGGGASSDGAQPPEPVLEPSDAWLDYDGLTMGAPADGRRRGRLGRDDGGQWRRDRDAAVGALDAAAPTGTRDPLASRGMFDHRYRAEGLAEVPSDGLTHRVPLGSGDATPTVRWRVIACERADVYREVELRNPFDAPLLAGPVDVYVDGSLLVVASIEHIDRGGALRVGMGVDDRLRAARNVRAKEDTAGLLGGDTVIDHVVTIELSSALGSPALVELIDRLPVTDDRSVEVTPKGARPEPERFTQAERGAAVRGGLRWEVIVPAGGRASVEFGYRLTIPTKNELVGGNRRG